MACALVEAPKLVPPAGTPPIVPASVVSTMLSIPSSAAIAATPSGIPIPRLTTASGVSSMAHLLAIILRLLSANGSSEPSGTLKSPLNAGLNS